MGFDAIESEGLEQQKRLKRRILGGQAAHTPVVQQAGQKVFGDGSQGEGLLSMIW